MGSDNLFVRRSLERVKRKENVIIQKSSQWLIVCEGTKTEPFYFEKAIEEVNRMIPDDYKGVFVRGEAQA